MGIQDRDYYRAQYRNVSSLDRGRKPPSTGRLALFWIAVLAIAFAAFRFVPMIWPRAPAALPPPVAPLPMQTAQQPSPTPPGAARTVPLEGSRAASPGAAPIYRCGNRYSDEPCAGGRPIDGAVASGFDSRPSEPLARLVAEGRSADGDSVTTTGRTVTTVVNNGSVVVAADRFGECPVLANEIARIDRDARQPQHARTQDWLRERRRHARDRQAQLHC